MLPQEYSIDYQEGIKNPIGLSGVRMGAKVHLITCHNDMARNIEKCVERVGLRVDQMIFSALASSYAVLTEDEKELGVCVVDIGGGTMDIAMFTGGALRYSKVIPYAGNTVTSDIAYAFGTPPLDAEAIKVRYGSALGRLVSKEDTIEVPSVGGRPARSLQRQTLAEVIEPRYCELLGLVQDEIGKMQTELRRAWASVLMAIKCTPSMLSRTMCSTALPPPPPTPITLMTASSPWLPTGSNVNMILSPHNLLASKNQNSPRNQLLSRWNMPPTLALTLLSLLPLDW